MQAAPFPAASQAGSAELLPHRLKQVCETKALLRADRNELTSQRPQQEDLWQNRSPAQSPDRAAGERTGRSKDQKPVINQSSAR
jgi:hypothetical protein